MTRSTTPRRSASVIASTIGQWLFITAMLATALLIIIAGIPHIAAYALTPLAHLLGGSL